MVLPGSIYSNIKTFHLWWSFHSFSSEAYRFSWHVCFISSGIRDFKIQRRGRDESRPEVKIPKMTTTAHDRDVNKPSPCSRRTRWRPFWRCWQTVSISTYFDSFKTVNWHFLFVYRKLNYPGYIPHVFFVVVSFQAQLNLRTVNTRNISCHGLEFQTAVSRFLHSSFSELRLKKQNDLLYKSNVVPDYFLLVEDFPILVKFIHRSYSHYASFCGNLIHALFPAEVVRDFKEKTAKQINRNM